VRRVARSPCVSRWMISKVFHAQLSGGLPIDKIKIDPSFVQRPPGDADAAAAINAVVLLSQPLGKSIIAEGIKTPDQAWMLKAHGLQAQLGFHLGRPMTDGQVLAYLDGPPRAAAWTSAGAK